MNQPKKSPIAALPAGVGVCRAGNYWRVRIGKRFTGGEVHSRKFLKLADARKWVDEQMTNRDGIRAVGLTPSAIADCRAALEVLAGRGSLVAAARFFTKHFRRPDETRSLDEAVSEFLVVKERKGCRPRSVNAYRDTLRAFALDHAGSMVAAITREDVEDWLDEEGWRLPTVRHHLVNLSVFFRWCETKGWLAVVPTLGIERPANEDKPPGILMVEQLGALFECASIRQKKQLEGEQLGEEFFALIPMLALGAFAGLRSSELRQLDWREIDCENRMIEVTAAKSKSRQRRIVDMTDNLFAWLLPFARSSGPVCPANHRKMFIALREKAGVEWPKNALRHSFASYHLAFHRDPGKTAYQLGHRDSQMLFRHYRELVKPLDAAAYWKICPAEDRKILDFAAENVA